MTKRERVQAAPAVIGACLEAAADGIFATQAATPGVLTPEERQRFVEPYDLRALRPRGAGERSSCFTSTETGRISPILPRAMPFRR